MNPILEQISNIGIVPVIAIDDAKKAVPLARALVAGGLPVAEVTFRTAAAEEAMRSITREVPEMLVGAGTVLTREQVDRALDAGAKFIVSPGFNPDTVRYVLSKGALMVPGTATPGEMEQAMSLGLDVVKFFPAEQNGGVAKLKAIAGPYKTLKWMPTGGGQCKEPDGLPLLRPDRGLRGHLDGEEGPDRGRKLGRNHPNDAGGGTHHAGLLPAPCGRQLRQRGGGGPAGPDAVRLFRLYVSDGQLLRTGPACGGVHKTPGPGAHGHIAIGTNSVDRAVYHLGLQGIRCREETRKTDARGKTKAIYVDGAFGGFAIHLVQA